MRKRSILAPILAGVLCFLPSCSAVASGGTADAISRSQSDQEIAKMIRDLHPTERVVPNADSRLLWQAASGYMQKAFPLDDLPAGVAEGAGGVRQIRTSLVEWTGEGLPHRTRVFVELRPDASNAANMRLRVTALMVESEPQLAQAKQGEPLQYNWRMTGGNPRIEETVADQILKRYEALRAGLPLPLEEEMVVPLQKST